MDKTNERVKTGLIVVAAAVIAGGGAWMAARRLGGPGAATEGEQFEVITDPADFLAVSEALTNAGIDMDESEITMIPDLIVEVTEKSKAESIMRFVDALEELDDVQDVYTNFDISDEVAAQLDAE